MLDLPDETHRRVMRYLDAVSATLAGQSCTQLLMVRAPECNLAPAPVIMSANQLTPTARSGTLNVRRMGSDLYPFAVRAAGLKTMIRQVVVAIGLGWADAEYLHPWVEAGGQQRLQRRAACDVVALKVPLFEAATAEYLHQRWPTVVQSLLARAHRPSSVRVPAPTFLVPKVSSSAAPLRIQPLPTSQALFRWGHLASRPIHPVLPSSKASGSLAARSKAKASSSDPEDAEDF